MNLADNLKKIRKDNNLSQEDLADKLGVSRQSVSKWESGQAYPEMDKVLQICKLFNININDLLNENISEIKERNESNNKINKYIDDFLNYITKTVKLFSSLSFKDKIKLLIEEGILILLALLIYNILDDILTNAFSFLFYIKGERNFYIYNFLHGIYIIVFFIIFIITLSHIFRVRYLDYYKPEDKKKEKDIETIDNKTNTDIKETRKEAKIIIRDEKNSSYSFINGLAKIILFFIKVFIFFILLAFIGLLVANVTGIVLLFNVIGNISLFCGLFITGVGTLIIISTICYALYNILIGKSIKYKLSSILLLAPFIICGIGIGLSITSIKNIDILGIEGAQYQVSEFTTKMSDDLYIEDEYQYKIKYQEDNRKDIYIVVKSITLQPLEIVENYDNNHYIRFDYPYGNEMDYVRKAIKDINDNKIYKYGEADITVYASKENIKKLQDNLKKIRYSEDEQENIEE